jgi:hypothetical protein
LFPRLKTLLGRAHVTEVVVDDKPLILFSWPAGNELAGWLCEAPADSLITEACSAHQVLFPSFVETIAEQWLIALA